MKTLDIFIFLKSPYAKHHGTMFCFSLLGETKKFVIFNGFFRQLKLNFLKKTFLLKYPARWPVSIYRNNSECVFGAVTSLKTDPTVPLKDHSFGLLID